MHVVSTKARLVFPRNISISFYKIIGAFHYHLLDFLGPITSIFQQAYKGECISKRKLRLRGEGTVYILVMDPTPLFHNCSSQYVECRSHPVFQILVDSQQKFQSRYYVTQERGFKEKHHYSGYTAEEVTTHSSYYSFDRVVTHIMIRPTAKQRVQLVPGAMEGPGMRAPNPQRRYTEQEMKLIQSRFWCVWSSNSTCSTQRVSTYKLTHSRKYSTQTGTEYTHFSIVFLFMKVTTFSHLQSLQCQSV